MRGQSLLKESSTSSVCAFCALRMRTCRRPSNTQRRYLNSSRISRTLPATGNSAHEEKINGASQKPSVPAASSWGRSNGSWGRVQSAPNWSKTPLKAREKPDLAQKNDIVDRTNLTNDAGTLLPHEQRAREALLENSREIQEARRQVVIHTGPGPQSNRAGRYVPNRFNKESSVPGELGPERRRNEFAKAKERNWNDSQSAQMRRGPSPANGQIVDENSSRSAYSADEIRLRGRPQGMVDESASFSPHETSSVDLTEDVTGARFSENPSGENRNWGKLRRVQPRAQADAQSKPGSQDVVGADRFAEARAQREERARTASYTPLRDNRWSNERDSKSRGWTRPDGWGPPRTLKTEQQSGNQNITTSEASRGRSSPSPDFPTFRTFVPDKPSSRQIDAAPEASQEISEPAAAASGLSTYKAFVPDATELKRSADVAERDRFDERRPLPQEKDSPRRKQERQQMRADEDYDDRKHRKTSKRGKEVHDMEEDDDEEFEMPRKAPSRFSDGVKSKGKGRARRQQLREEEEDDDDDGWEAAALARAERKKRKAERAAKKLAAPTPILLPEYITVANLAMALRVRAELFAEKMEELGYEEISLDHILNAEDSALIAQEYNFEAIIDRGESEDLKPREPAEDPSTLPPRPPVVTIMGHVDHGKTTLLDWLRKSSVAAGEHGGITQHIGAFSVKMPGGKIITFLDTPGHAAFLSMRQRGANVTDIVILVVAADDSVKPQTIEAINHAKSAKVPIIVAINKIDKEEANIDRVKQDLARHGVEVEDYGGDTQVVCVSGKTGQGMETLEESAVTLSEILDMRAEIDGPAEGWVLEASIKSMGKVATVLVRRGTMRPGDFIVAGKTWSRIRVLRNEAGVEIESAGPGTPVQIDGWREQPLAGDLVLQAPDEQKAKTVIEYRLESEEREKMAEDMDAINTNRKVEQDRREREKEEARLAALDEAAGLETTSPEDKPAEPKLAETKLIHFIVKADVSGSVEAIVDQINSLGNKEVRPALLRSGVGQLSEFDIEHAAAAGGHVINFNTPVDPHIAQLAERARVTIFDQNIIYRLVDDIRDELSKHLPPLITQRVLGEAEIAQVFDITVKGRKQKPVAGCKVRNGTVGKLAKVKVWRGGVGAQMVFDGTLASLKNVKKDVMEMKKGNECGMGFEGWDAFEVGDLVQSYEEKQEKRYL